VTVAGVKVVNGDGVCVIYQPDLGRDEFTFRALGHRLSFVSSPESDYDVAAAAASSDVVDTHRPVRASSDPSIAAADNSMPRPVDPPPAPPRPQVHPHLGYDPYYVCHMQYCSFMLLQ